MKGKRKHEHKRSSCKTHQRTLRRKRLTPNGISIIAGVPQATVKSILNGESKNPGVGTIKKLCDGFGVTLGQFFSTETFDALEPTEQR